MPKEIPADRLLDIFRVVMGYARSNVDDINAAFEGDEPSHYIYVGGRKIDKLTEEEVIHIAEIYEKAAQGVTLPQIGGAAAHTLVCEINGIEELIGGDTREDCLQRFKERLYAANGSHQVFISAAVSKGFKEECVLIKGGSDDADPEIHTGKWNVDTRENGAGESKPFRSFDSAIKPFMRYAESAGEHWQ